MFRTKLLTAIMALGVLVATPALAAGPQGHGSAGEAAPIAVGWKLQHAFHHYFGPQRHVDRHVGRHIQRNHYPAHRRHHWQGRHHRGHWGPPARRHRDHAWQEGRGRRDQGGRHRGDTYRDDNRGERGGGRGSGRGRR